MNLDTFKISITPCVVCGYAFSDKHHIWPQAKGGKGLPTINLCPNHHRFANVVQAMLLQGAERQQIEVFAGQYFDEAFTTSTLPFLIDEQERLAPSGKALFHLEHFREAAKIADWDAMVAEAKKVGIAMGVTNDEGVS